MAGALGSNGAGQPPKVAGLPGLGQAGQLEHQAGPPRPGDGNKIGRAGQILGGVDGVYPGALRQPDVIPFRGR